jgi:hypothetical protein
VPSGRVVATAGPLRVSEAPAGPTCGVGLDVDLAVRPARLDKDDVERLRDALDDWLERNGRARP